MNINFVSSWITYRSVEKAAWNTIFHALGSFRISIWSWANLYCKRDDMHFICWAVSPHEMSTLRTVQTVDRAKEEGKGVPTRRLPTAGPALQAPAPSHCWSLSLSSTRASAFCLDFLKGDFKIESEQEYMCAHTFLECFQGWCMRLPASNLWSCKAREKRTQTNFNLVSVKHLKDIFCSFYFSIWEFAGRRNTASNVASLSILHGPGSIYKMLIKCFLI